MNRSLEEMHSLYDRLPKDEDGKLIIKKKEPYSKRYGQTKQPKFEKLDLTEVSPSQSHIIDADCVLNSF